ncbi:dihydroorotase [Nocardia sp. NPDC056000]|uniref:dihydroorotase n=1 Tax=Nocardia sp. NPDC056000 TaxID=3345674 RepID=UPI0035DF8345
MNNVLIQNVRLYGEGDPVDVLLADGEIREIGAGLKAEDAEIIDGTGQFLLPGFIDLHTHLREPGREDTETIETGSAAAALGGYTAVFAMANTSPVADSQVITDHVWRRGQQVGLVDVHPVGAVTVGLEGKQLAEMGTMAAGVGAVRMFSDDGHCVYDPLIMRRALEYANSLGVLIAQHAEEPRLTKGAVAHEGPNAARLGLAGWPRAAEESIVARDALLARDAGARVHICHASTAGTVELLKWAKSQGISITAEVTPHHLLLDDSRLETYDAVNRVNPPLRESSDVTALRQALADGVIDCVATDHAPHAEQDKCCEFAAARPGMLGLETALSIIVQTMVQPGLLDWRGVARVMSENPARIVGLDDQGRPLAVGEPANLALIDPNTEWTVRAKELASIAHNTPFDEMTLPAKVTATFLRGRVTSRNGVASAPRGGDEVFAGGDRRVGNRGGP